VLSLTPASDVFAIFEKRLRQRDRPWKDESIDSMNMREG
jgi:hypothetical protein